MGAVDVGGVWRVTLAQLDNIPADHRECFVGRVQFDPTSPGKMEAIVPFASATARGFWGSKGIPLTLDLCAAFWKRVLVNALLVVVCQPLASSSQLTAAQWIFC